MKSRVLISLVLLVSLLIANTIPNRRQTEKVFKTLLSHELGKDIYASIQLELTTSNENNIVDTILNMLYELRNSFESNAEDSEAELAEKQESCGGKIGALQVGIEDLTERIAKAQSTLPILEEASLIKSLEADEKQKEVDASNSIISGVHEKNTIATAAYEASVQEHDDMIDALIRAKQLISQLSATGFLQKSLNSSNSVLIQLQKHSLDTLDKLPNHQHRGVFKLLVDLAQDVGIQADQSQVADIIAIIDELINHERETASVEREADQMRTERFNFDLTRANASAQQLDAQIKDLLADTHSLGLKVKELSEDIRSWGLSQDSKQEQLDLQVKTCDDAEVSVKSTIESTTDTLGLIQQVIEIFESEDIQDIRTVVSDIEYSS